LLNVGLYFCVKMAHHQLAQCWAIFLCEDGTSSACSMLGYILTKIISLFCLWMLDVMIIFEKAILHGARNGRTVGFCALRVGVDDRGPSRLAWSVGGQPPGADLYSFIR